MDRFADRQISGRRLEPADNTVIHGAGQSGEEFRSYARLLDTTPPELYMTYMGLSNAEHCRVFGWLARELDSHDGLRLVPQIGLSMTSDGRPWRRYDNRVAAGELDREIDQFCEGLATLARPVYVRLAYEFNGEWNGYDPEDMKRAWVRIWTAFRRHGLDDVALVWCYAPDAEDTSDHRPFYPGDEYVDWWGVDLFSARDFTSPKVHRFLDDAERRGFPVMIGESTPRYTGVLDGADSWREWFEPYFNMIRVRPCIRSFCYINWNWGLYPQWIDWGDCRIGENPEVLARYRREMAQQWYRHAARECVETDERQAA